MFFKERERDKDIFSSPDGAVYAIWQRMGKAKVKPVTNS